MNKKISIYVHPFFWIFAALIGLLMSGSIIGTFYWIIIIFVSVLVHELGHATMAVIFKQRPKIELVFMGGLTSYRGKSLRYYQQFLIVLNGPLFGIMLFLFASLVLWLNFFKSPNIVGAFKIMQIVNLFWSIVNLFPVLPLDGGQLLRIALEGFMGVRGFKLSLLIGFIFAAAVALASFAVRYYFIGALFFLFAFQSFDMYRKSKNLQKCDRDEKLAHELELAQKLLKKGDLKKAEKLFEDLRNKTHEGLIFNQATHFLAYMFYEREDFKKAYEYLLSVQDKLNEEAVCLLHKLAFQENNFELVKKLSSDCYKLSSTKKVALINARAFAILGEAKPAGGWLQTAIQFNDVDLKQVLSEKYFEKIKNDPTFLSFFK